MLKRAWLTYVCFRLLFSRFSSHFKSSRVICSVFHPYWVLPHSHKNQVFLSDIFLQNLGNFTKILQNGGRGKVICVMYLFIYLCTYVGTYLPMCVHCFFVFLLPSSQDPPFHKEMAIWTDVAFCFMPGLSISAGCTGTPLR
jgi:hypothetical protein